MIDLLFILLPLAVAIPIGFLIRDTTKAPDTYEMEDTPVDAVPGYDSEENKMIIFRAFREMQKRGGAGLWRLEACIDEANRGGDLPTDIALYAIQSTITELSPIVDATPLKRAEKELEGWE